VDFPQSATFLVFRELKYIDKYGSTPLVTEPMGATKVYEN